MKKLIALIFVIALTGQALFNQLAAQEVTSRIIEEGGTGPYGAIMRTVQSLPTHTIFHPKDLSVFGKQNKLPIIAWGNGACANSPWGHLNFLNEVASHGFLIIAIGPMPKAGERGKGKSESSQMLDAIDWAISSNSEKGDPFFNIIDTTKIAVSGMSCGGLQALLTQKPSSAEEFGEQGFP